MDAKEISQQLIEILEEKFKIYKQIYVLTKEQSNAISDEHIKEFTELFKEKQVLIEKANELDDLFEQKFNDGKKLGKQASFAEVLSKHIDIKQVQKIIIDIEKLENTIKSLEMENSKNYKAMVLDKIVKLRHFGTNKKNKIEIYKKVSKYSKTKKEKTS